MNSFGTKVGAMALITGLLALAGCGGGGGGSGGSGGPPAAVTLSGAVSKGPLSAAVVTAYAVDASGNVGSTALGQTTTNADGSYSLTLSGYSGTVQLVATVTSSTTVADEVSGQSVALPSTFALHANTVVAAGSGDQSQSASLTPYTELANRLAQGYGGLTAANITNANGAVFKLLGLDPVATVPVASTAPQAATSLASVAQLRYALYNAAVSELANSTPTTSNATTLSCFNNATDLGAKIQCATSQIATAVTVTPGTTNVVATTNLVGLSSALTSVSASPTVNQTGQTIASGDSVVTTLAAQETAATNGTAASTPIATGTITQASTDVATAKLFFSGLRANAAALGTSTVSTGIVDGMKAFSDSLSGDLSSLSVDTTQLIALADRAHGLWVAYTTGQTTNPSGAAVPNNGSGGCTIYQGTVPTPATVFHGGASNTQPYVSTSVVATASGNATWIGCSVNDGPLLASGAPRWRQTIIIDPSAGWGSATYMANTREQYISTTDGQTYLVNLTPTYTGTISLTSGSGGNGYSIIGNLPPATDTSGNVLSAYYPVDIVATVSQLANGANQVSVSSGTLGVVPVGATAATLKIDLAVGGQLVAALPSDRTNAAQVAATQVNWKASISEPNGSINGSVLLNQFSYNAATGSLKAGNLAFTGSIAVAPVVAGTAGSVATWANLTLNMTQGTTKVVSFSGSLTPAGLAPLAIKASITETATDTYSLQGSYVQGGANVSITASQSPSAESFTFADASGVSVSLTGAATNAVVTVSGRQAATIDRSTDIITYSDGSFETLVNP